jgi:GntR family transcriptional repressor for pyruvate dehydrogenase complex
MTLIGMTQDEQLPSLGNQAYSRLLSMLNNGEFAPSERLPSEEKLARQIGVSRPVLRQALDKLRAEEKIYSRKGSGHYVSAPSESPPAPVYGALNSIADVRDFLQFRMTIEIEAAALAAQSDDQDALQQIAVAHQRLNDALADRSSGIEEDLAFHVAIARASANRFYLQTMESVANQMRLSIRLIRDLSVQPAPSRASKVLQEHAEIEAAIRERDPQRARQAMEAHLKGGIVRLFGRG